MLQPPDKLSSALFVDPSFAGEPVQACSNGHTYCSDCLQEAIKSKNQCPTCNVELISIGSNRVVKNLIGNASVYCFTRQQALEAVNSSPSGLTDGDTDDDDKHQASAAAASSGKRKNNRNSSSSSSATSKKSKPDHCMWTGKLHDAKQHFTECVYAGVLCTFGCGAIVLRKDVREHEASLCPEHREVQCTNAGCNALMPADSMLVAHKANACLYQTVDCPFKSVGCTECLLRKDIKNHTDTTTDQHMLLMLQDNRSLREDNESLLQKVAELEQECAESFSGYADDLEEWQSRQPQEIVFKVNVADLVRDGEVRLHSDHKEVGAYNVCMEVSKGFAEDHDKCGVYLHLRDGLFPCRVTCTFEIVHWGGNNGAILKYEVTNTYEEVKGRGPQTIPPSKITAAASPYVKDGHVTFIAKFQILPLE